MALELQTKFEVGTIRVANLDTLKQELEHELQEFKQLPITKQNMPVLRQARARLNKAAEAFNKRRIELAKAYNEPFLAFKQDVDGIIGQINSVLEPLDFEIKNFEDEDRKEKRQKIVDYYTYKYVDPIVPFDRIFEEKWLNYGMSLENIYRDIVAKISEIEKNLAMIETMSSDKPEIAKQLKTEYLLTLDLQAAYDNVNKRKEVASKLDTHTSSNAPTGELNVTFKVYGSKEKLMTLSKFLKENGYVYERLQ